MTKAVVCIALLGMLVAASSGLGATAQDVSQPPPPNLLANGNFEVGNVGFKSGYRFVTEPTTAPGQEGHYTLGTNPQKINGLGASFGDHTSGTGCMFIANGAENPEGQVVWEQSVMVKPRTMYRFSFWVASWGRLGDSPTAANPAKLEARIHGEGPGKMVTVTTPATVGKWRYVSVLWLSGASTKARIVLIDRNHEFIGNDFALDDMAFQSMDIPRYSEDTEKQPARQ